MCNVWPEDWISADELRPTLKSNNTSECLQWLDHIERMAEWKLCKCRTLKVSGSILIARSRKTWNEVIRNNLKERKISQNLAKDRKTWKSLIRTHPT